MTSSDRSPGDGGGFALGHGGGAPGGLGQTGTFSGGAQVKSSPGCF